MDIEEDIKKLNKYIELVIDKDYCDCNELNVIIGKHCDGSKNVAYAIKNTLAEREEDKKKIAELEKENHKILENGIDVIRDSIAKQTVRDKIKELKNNLKYIACNEDCSKCFNQEGKALYRESNFVFCFAYHQIKVLQQLLEDK